MIGPNELVMRMLCAEEAIASNEIEGMKLTPRERFIMKCKMIWPDLDTKEIGMVYDHMEKQPITTNDKDMSQ